MEAGGNNAMRTPNSTSLETKKPPRMNPTTHENMKYDALSHPLRRLEHVEDTMRETAGGQI